MPSTFHKDEFQKYCDADLFAFDDSHDVDYRLRGDTGASERPHEGDPVDTVPDPEGGGLPGLEEAGLWPFPNEPMQAGSENSKDLILLDVGPLSVQEPGIDDWIF